MFSKTSFLTQYSCLNKQRTIKLIINRLKYSTKIEEKKTKMEKKIDVNFKTQNKARIIINNNSTTSLEHPFKSLNISTTNEVQPTLHTIDSSPISLKCKNIILS